MPFGGFPPMEVYMAGSLRNCVDTVYQHQHHKTVFFRWCACTTPHHKVATVLASCMLTPQEFNLFLT